MDGVDTRCWVWTGGKDPSGYGKFYWEGRTIGAHRASFLLLTGVSQKSCAISAITPSCVRPDHLYAGDDESNLIDIYAAQDQEAVCLDVAVAAIAEGGGVGLLSLA